jgi:phosphoribosylaminoimidazole carboxylase (NCAIR synthetase)
MINLLGQEISCSYNLNFPFIEGSYEYKIHLYGKKESRLGRKLGHVTLFGNETNIEIAKQINNEYTL